MSNTRTIIVIWGVSILAYLALTRASGTTSILGSLSNLVNTSTKTLQGR